MNAKHSALLLTGLLLLMIGIAWAQTIDPVRPTCPVVIYQANVNWRPSEGSSKWIRADWNAKADLWEIDCDSEFRDGNSTNAAANALPASGSRHYNALTNSANWSDAANAVNARPRRRPSTRRRPSE